MNDATELDQELAELDELLAVIEKRRVEVVNEITAKRLVASEQVRRVLSLVRTRMDTGSSKVEAGAQSAARDDCK